MILRTVDVADTTRPPSQAEADVAGPWETIIVVPVPRHLELRDLDPILHSLDDQWLAAVDAIVLRLHPSSWRAFEHNKRVIETLHERFQRPLAVVTWADGEHALHSAAEPLPDGLDEAALLDAIRKAEVASLLDLPGVVLPESPTLHYEGPNGEHYTKFIRVGTAVQAVDHLDGLAFWLLNELDGSQVLLLDSWTILSIGLNVSRYLKSEQLESLAPVAVECLRSYDENAISLGHRLEYARDQSAGDVSALILMSVSSTGDLSRRLQRACREAELAPIITVSLFGPTADTTDTVMCVLEDLGAYHSRSACPLCDDHCSVVRVRPETYLLEVAAGVETTAITKFDAHQGIRFFERYGGLGSVSVHKDQDIGSRHHGIDIDVKRLLQASAKFRDDLNAKIDKLMKRVATDKQAAPPATDPGSEPRRRGAYGRPRPECDQATEGNLRRAGASPAR